MIKLFVRFIFQVIAFAGNFLLALILSPILLVAGLVLVMRKIIRAVEVWAFFDGDRAAWERATQRARLGYN